MRSTDLSRRRWKTDHSPRRALGAPVLAALLLACAAETSGAKAVDATAFREALISADPLTARSAAGDDEQVRAAEVLASIAADGVAETFARLCALAETARDPWLREWAKQALLAGLRAEGEWDRLATLRDEHPALGLSTEAIPAAMTAWRTMHLQIAADPLRVTLVEDAGGRLVAPCDVRGPSATAALAAILDTGAATCVMRADRARDLGIRPVSDSPLPVIGITGAVSSAQAAVLPELRFAGLIATAVPLTIVPETVAREALGDVEFLIGWEVLQRVALEFDLASGTLIVGPGQLDEPNAAERNLCLVGEPAVRVLCGGVPALFLLDTGTTATEMTSAGAARLGLGAVDRRPDTLSGVGGSRSEEVSVLEKFALRSGVVEIGLEGVVAAPSGKRHELLRIDGTLGMDVLGALRVIVDAPARRFRLQAR